VNDQSEGDKVVHSENEVEDGSDILQAIGWLIRWTVSATTSGLLRSFRFLTASHPHQAVFIISDSAEIAKWLKKLAAADGYSVTSINPTDPDALARHRKICEKDNSINTVVFLPMGQLLGVPS